MRIGFIGLGIMGRPMVGHLLDRGHAVQVFSRTRAKAADALARGAVWRDSSAACATGVELLALNVTDTPDVEAVLFGPDGAADTLARGALVIDFSTISPAATRDFAARLAERGVDYVDAPVTGGQVGAENATLTILCGGAAPAFERARPVLEQLGQKIVHVGPPGAGQALKAVNQILCAVNMMGVCEALLLAEQSGVDPAAAIDALSAGAGGSWAWSQLGKKLTQNDLQPAFMIKLMQKDLRIVQDAAQTAGVPLPATALAQQLFRAVEAQAGGAELGTQAMMLAYRKMRGVE